MNKNNFKNSIIEIVKLHEIDMLGVCNNAVYFNYFEDARIKYLQDLSLKYSFKKFLVGDSFFIMAHNEIDYLRSACLDDSLKIYTKINTISKSSFSFEHIIVRELDNVDIAKGGGVVVHINRLTKQSFPLPEEFYKAVQDYEVEVKIIK